MLTNPWDFNHALDKKTLQQRLGSGDLPIAVAANSTMDNGLENNAQGS